MTVVQGMRFANTFYDIENIATSIPDEMLIRKKGPEAGRLFYKDKDGNVIDLFDKFASQIKADEIQDLLNDVLQKANEYTDDAIVNVGSGQSTKVVRYVYLLRAAANQTIFNIPLSTFDKDEDFIMFTTNTVMPDEGFTITNSSIIFDEGLDAGTTVRIIIIKNIPVGPEGSIDAKILKPGSITEDLLDPALLQKIYDMIAAGGGGIPTPGTPMESVISFNRPAVATTDSWIQLEEANSGLEGISGNMLVSETQPTDPNVKIWLEPVSEVVIPEPTPEPVPVAEIALSSVVPAVATTESFIQLDGTDPELEGVSGAMRVSDTQPTDPNVKVWLESVE